MVGSRLYHLIHGLQKSADCNEQHEAPTMNFASLGSVSSGTLRTEDLLEAFTAELEDCVQRNAEAWCSDAGRAQRDSYMSLIGEARGFFDGTGELDEAHIDDAYEIVNDLFNALQEFAPEGAYFGAHIGDGADFGYWPTED